MLDRRLFRCESGGAAKENHHARDGATMSQPAGAIAYEVDDGIPATVRIVPSDRAPETSSDGVATAMLYVSQATGMLALGTRWWPAERELSEIRTTLATTMERAPEEFVITSDAFHVSAVRLLLSAGSGQPPIELGRSSTSGVPPFTALFSADVSDHLEPVQLACAGQPGLLYVQVEAELTRGRSATTTLAATLADWAADLPEPDDDDLPARIESLIQAGSIERTRSAKI